METIHGDNKKVKTTLSICVNQIRSTIALMDEFEHYPVYSSNYKTLELEDALRFFLEGEGRFTINLNISRKKPGWFPEFKSGNEYKGITFTELLRLYKDQIYFRDLTEMNDNGMWDAIRLTIKQNATRKMRIPINLKLKMAVPYRFHAQHSAHKTGFGDKYRWGELVEIGTKYGDTDSYYISYIKIN